MDCDRTVTRFSADPRGSSGAGVAFQNCHELRPRAASRGGVRVLGEGDSYWGTQLGTKHVAFLTGRRVSAFRRRVEGSGQAIVTSTVATRWVRPCTSWSSLSLNQTMLSTNIYKHLLCAYCFLCVQCLPLTQSYLLNKYIKILIKVSLGDTFNYKAQLYAIISISVPTQHFIHTSPRT